MIQSIHMKQILLGLLTAAIVTGCNSKDEKGKFTLQGDVKNVPNQQVYLEQLFFTSQEAQVLDTANIENGHFEVSSTATEDGLYRIRFEKTNSGFIFINDQPKINFKADINDASIAGPTFTSPANQALKNLLLNIEGQRVNLMATSRAVDSLKTVKASDSAIAATSLQLANINGKFNQFITKYIDTVSQPIVALFALGYTQGMDPASLNTVVPNLVKRFPNHQGVIGVVTQFNEMIAAQNQPKPTNSNTPGVGSMAPDFSMNDTEGR
ncbi:MAG: DUF4369 domain-containing protein, partial [Chitinophagaceae bacterium]